MFQNSTGTERYCGLSAKKTIVTKDTADSVFIFQKDYHFIIIYKISWQVILMTI